MEQNSDLKIFFPKVEPGTTINLSKKSKYRETPAIINGRCTGDIPCYKCSLLGTRESCPNGNNSKPEILKDYQTI